VENVDVAAGLMLAAPPRGSATSLTRPAFDLIDVPRTWLGVRPQGQVSAGPRLPVRIGGLAGVLSLTSRVGLVLMDTARVRHPRRRERC